MNALTISLSYLRHKPGQTMVTVATFAAGIAIITILLLVNSQVQGQLTRNLKGIDLVVGPKGSPMQLIMSTVFHLDIPVGSVSLDEAERLARDPLIARGVPVALGDNHQGFRIVGTRKDFIDLYQARIRSGGHFGSAPLEVVIGATMAVQTGLKTGDTFTGAHGLTAGGEQHGDTPYTVTGILEPTGSIIDRLAITPLESVWQVHEHSGAGAATDGSHDDDRRISAMLITYSSPLGAVNLPTRINASMNMQAASPAFEVARLNRFMGVGAELLNGIAWFLVALAGFGIFAGLYNAMDERRYDLALMRCFGASPGKLVSLIILESLIISGTGLIIGITGGHLIVEVLGRVMEARQNLGITGFTLAAGEFWLPFLGALTGLIASAIPALRVYRLDIYRTLVQR